MPTVNSAATGAPTVDGTAAVGETLTADTSGIADENGLATVSWRYRWFRTDGGTNTGIDGATSRTYTLTSSDLGKKIGVAVTFTDDDGFEESPLASGAFPSNGTVGTVIPDIGDAEEVWSGTLAVQNIAVGNVVDRGCNNSVANGRCRTGAILSDDDFSYDNRRYAIEEIAVRTQGPGGVGRLSFGLSGDLPDDRDEWTLHVGSRKFRFEDSVAASDRYGTWNDSGLDWPAGRAINLRISRPDRTPLTARLSQGKSVTDDNGEVLRYSLTLTLSAKVWMPWREMRDRAFTAEGGRIATARRSDRSKETIDGRERSVASRWSLDVEPDEPDGRVKVTLKGNRACDEDGAICSPNGRSLARDATVTLKPAVAVGPMSVSIADTEADEADGVMLFDVTLSAPSEHWHEVWVRTTGRGTATAGADFRSSGDVLVLFEPGATRQRVGVALIDDTVDDDGETVVMEITRALEVFRYSGAKRPVTVADGEAVGTNRNLDAMPRAWIARFGRTVAEQVVEAVESRMRAPRTAGVEVSLAGRRIGGAGFRNGAASDEAAAAERSLAGWLRNGADPERQRGLGARSATGRELLTGSSFALSGGTERDGSYALWGRAAVSRFDGRDGDLALDGEVVSGMLGADWTRNALTAGLVVAHSRGAGGYRAAAGGGTVSSTLTGLYPWGRYAVSERITVWGVAGYGAGTLTLTPEGPDLESRAAIRTDLDLTMAAAGLRGVLVQAPEGGGLELAVKTDAMGVRTSTAKAPGMSAAEAGVTRLRLGLEGSWRIPFEGGATLTPSMEVGVRQDGGDAETGFGADIGGGLAWSDPQRGLSAELRGRGLLSHEAKGFRERGLSGALSFDPAPDSARGLKLTLSQTVGAQASGGMDALLERSTLAGLAANDSPASGSGAGGDRDDELANRRFEMRLGYGLSAFGDRFTMTPELGLGLSNAGRDVSLGWRLTREARYGGALALALEARRRENDNDNARPEHSLGFRLTARF